MTGKVRRERRQQGMVVLWDKERLWETKEEESGDFGMISPYRVRHIIVHTHALHINHTFLAMQVYSHPCLGQYYYNNMGYRGGKGVYPPSPPPLPFLVNHSPHHSWFAILTFSSLPPKKSYMKPCRPMPNLVLHVVWLPYQHSLEFNRLHWRDHLPVYLLHNIPNFEQALSVNQSSVHDSGNHQLVSHQSQSDTLNNAHSRRLTQAMFRAW